MPVSPWGIYHVKQTVMVMFPDVVNVSFLIVLLCASPLKDSGNLLGVVVGVNLFSIL